MDNPAPPIRHPRLTRAVAAAGHPLLLATALGTWWTLGADQNAALAALLATMLAAMILERLIPAMPAWRLGVGATLRLAAVYVLGLMVSAALIATYESLLPTALAGVRAHIAQTIRPADWPVPVQALSLYFASDFVYYWIHRSIHRFPWLWRITGHGFHHGFQNMHAINAGANHPFELVFVVLPLVLLASVSGASDQAVGAAGVLLVGNVTLAHANLRMRTPVFSFFFTSADQHRRHHSAVFEESNTNYACNAILWDRLFGTYSRGEVLQTGIGPTQPTLWRMFLLPFREPEDADTIASRSRSDGIR